MILFERNLSICGIFSATGDFRFLQVVARFNAKGKVIFRTGLSFNNPIRIYGYDLPEAMHRMQFLPFSNDFRDDYVFNNLLFAVAAWVIENLDGIINFQTRILHFIQLHVFCSNERNEIKFKGGHGKNSHVKNCSNHCK